MNLLPEKLAELEAERDWLLWKKEEHKKWKKSGDSEYCYSQDPGEQQTDAKRLTEIKALLKNNRSKNE
jgi:hypothetical protein